jgi:cytochrome oxidase Cu insertion factor (SCO1/SenC/PrrC family)
MALPKPPKFAVWIGLLAAIALVFLFRPSGPPTDDKTKQAMEMKAALWMDGEAALRNDEDGTAEPAGDAQSALLGGPFSLIDHTGQAVTERDYLGSYTLVYFASTDCSGDCEKGLGAIVAAVDGIGGGAATITPIMITTDPEADSVAALARFAATVHPRLSALTGSLDQVEQAARAYGIDLEGEAPSSPIFLIDPKGRYVTHFDRTIAPDDLSAGIQGHF